MRVECAGLQQVGHHELHQVLRLRIGALLERREVFDDRLRRGDPSETQAGCEHLREAVQINHDRLIVERRERRRRRPGKRQLAVGIVFDHRHPVPRGHPEELAPHPQRHRPAGRILKGRIRVDQLRAIPEQQVFELVEIAMRDVPPVHARAGFAKAVNRADVAGTVDDDDAAQTIHADIDLPVATAREILASAGVTSEWIDCGRGGDADVAARCTAPLGPAELSVRLVSQPMPPHHRGALPMGDSLIDSMAHDARWSEEELRRPAPIDWLFASGDARHIREALVARAVVQAAANHLVWKTAPVD